MKSKFYPALAVIVGTVIGAGFLGIPYSVSKSGFFIGIVVMLLIALAVLYVKLCLGEICLRTKENHQLPGYAEKYLGKKGKILMFLAMIFGIFPALTAYIIAEGKSLSYLVFGNYSYVFLFAFLFWCLMSILAYEGLVALKRYGKIAVALIFIIVTVLCFVFIPKIQTENLTYLGNDSFTMLGVILFSFLAFSAIPEARRILSNQEDKMKKAIVLGIIIPLLFYALFTAVSLGVFGVSINEIATLSFGRFFSLIGILTMFTAFFSQVLAIRDMFRFDFGFSRTNAWALSCIAPLIMAWAIFQYNLANFVQIISFGGIVSGGLTGILIILMAGKAKKLGKRKPEYTIKLKKIFIISILAIFAILTFFELYNS